MGKKKKYLTPSISIISYGSEEYSNIMNKLIKMQLKECSNPSSFDRQEEWESIDDYHCR